MALGAVAAMIGVTIQWLQWQHPKQPTAGREAEALGEEAATIDRPAAPPAAPRPVRSAEGSLGGPAGSRPSTAEPVARDANAGQANYGAVTSYGQTGGITAGNVSIDATAESLPEQPTPERSQPIAEVPQ
jgi:hypothetical protein